MYSMIPVRVFSEIMTEKCNLNCTYCFEHYKSGKNKNAEDSYNSITNNKTRDIIPHNKVFDIGGEPFLNIEYIEKFNNLVENNNTITNNTKDKLIKSNNSVITNGTLLEKNFEFINKNNIHLQISLDGTKESHDNNRVDYNGAGSWDTIIDNIKFLEKNNYNNYSIHSVLSSKDFDKFFDVIKNHIKLMLYKNKDIDMSRNLVALVLESEVTDEQINTLIQQFYKVVNYILYDNDLNSLDPDFRKTMAVKFLSRQGSSTCSAGTTMFISNSDNKVFGCHRLCTYSNEDLELYDLKDNKIKNINTYLQLIKNKQLNFHYGPYKNTSLRDQENSYWGYICVATSHNVCGNFYSSPAKFNVLEAELHRAIKYIADIFGLNIYNKKSDNKRS